MNDKILVQKTIFCWNAVVALILQPVQVTDELCKRVQALMRVFLSFFAQLEMRINENKVKRLESTSCIISLLNVAGDMKLHGTQRNLWEGSYFGEGMFRVVKSLVARGLYCRGTAKSVLQKYYSIRELDCMISEIESHEIDEQIDEWVDK